MNRHERRRPAHMMSQQEVQLTLERAIGSYRQKRSLKTI
jgi:hypothetical protein